MSDPLVKVIVNDFYYKCPNWLNKKIKIKDYISLSKNTSEEDVDLFLIQLLGNNDINVDQHPNEVFHNLIEEEQITMHGGILFIENTDKMIYPGCCSFIENWRDILQDVIEKRSPWMGHDPHPVMEFIGNKVRVWSDDCLGIYKKNSPKKDQYFIEFDRDDLINKLKAIEINLKEFIHFPLYNRIM